MYENHHSSIFMNINEKCIIGHQHYEKEWVPTYRNVVKTKIETIETTGIHGYRAVFPVVNLVPCIFMMNIFNGKYQ